MRVAAINGSPHKGEGITALILNPFLDGLRDGGAEVELFYTKELNVNPCQGDLNCWLKTPGRCSQQDDMQWLGPKLNGADVLVLASPVYVFGVTGPLKNVLDRIIPGIEPFFELRNGHCTHPLKPGTKWGKIVLVSSCGFWEMDNFEPLAVQMQTLCRIAGAEFAGALLRPHGPAFGRMLAMGAPVGDVLEAAKAAGRQLASGGGIQQETLSAVSRPLLSQEECIALVNQYFRAELDKLPSESNKAASSSNPNG